MSEVVFKRGPRVAGPEMPEGNLELAEPPVLGEPATADAGALLTYLPMGLGGATMTLMYSTGSRGTGSYLMSGMMGASMMAMGLGQLGRNGSQRKSQMRAERRDYLRYLDQVRRQAREAAVAIIYDKAGDDIWNTGTSGHPGAYFRLGHDGNVMVVYQGHAIWNAGTKV